MTPVPAELAVVERILVLWRQGKTFAVVAATLNAEGARTKRGGSWHASTVWNVVHSGVRCTSTLRGLRSGSPYTPVRACMELAVRRDQKGATRPPPAP